MITVFDIRNSDSPLVEFVWSSRSEGGGSFISTAVSNWEMVVTRQQDRLTLSIRGPETQASRAPVPENAEFFGIIFKHGAFMPQMPKGELVDRAVHINETTKNEFEFFSSTWQFPTFENADAFVHRLSRSRILSFDPLVEDALRGQAFFSSQRTIQRRFLHVTGLSHKTIQQIERAREASSLLRGGMPIPEAAIQAGYFDQAHLTNALKRFYGQTPAQIMHQSRIYNDVFFQDEPAINLYNQVNNNQKEME